VERLTDQQLGYIQANRDKRVTRRFPKPVGQVAAEFLSSGVATGPAWRRKLVGLLEEQAGKELLAHASIVGVRAGVLRLHVAEPALMYSLRLMWEQRLLNLLRTELPEAGVHTVRFTTGAGQD
jgi:hypothetical protein